MTEFRFYVPLGTKQVISEALLPANLLLVPKKQKPNTKKQ